MALFTNLKMLFAPSTVYMSGADGYGVHVANMDAATLYRTQPNLRAAISFLADNAAQVPIKVHERKSDDDRPRVLDSAAAKLLSRPNPDMTAFEYKRWVYSDLYLYERHLSLVLPSKHTDSGWEMRPIPAPWIVSFKGADPFAPESVVIGTGNGPLVEVPRGKFLLFHGYDPTDPMRQCSRISALAETLHEQVESNRFRRQMWQRGGRFNAYLTRPKDVQPWSSEAFDRFKETWKASWAGSDAGEGGGMPILEDGMEIKTVQFNSRDAQWAESVKLAREDVAAMYRFNPALLWPGTGQTYASARDNARALYNECLAPTLMQVTDRLTGMLFPMVGEPEGHYAAYDITIKTEGTFEEKIAALQSAVGAPFLTRDEARAKLDLPAIGADELIVPLNVIEGGLASGHDTDPTVERYNSLAAGIDRAREALGLKSAVAGGTPEPTAPRKSRGEPAEGDSAEIAKVLRAFFRRQAKSVLPKIGSEKARGTPAKAGMDAPTWWSADRWDKELADDLFGAFMAQAARNGAAALDELRIDGEFDAARIENYIKAMTRGKAQALNLVTLRQLLAALDDDLDEDAEGATPEGVFEMAEESRADRAGISFATAVAGWARLEAVRQRYPDGGATKTWIVTSPNPRASHAAMDGETVPYDEAFSNGAAFPGDQVLTPEESCNCQCQVEIYIP